MIEEKVTCRFLWFGICMHHPYFLNVPTTFNLLFCLSNNFQTKKIGAALRQSFDRKLISPNMSRDMCAGTLVCACHWLWSGTHKKQLGICIEYTYISEFMLWLHWGKFVNIKWIKIPSLAAQGSKYIKQWINVHEPLENITYLWKKLFFNFLGTDFLAPKSSHQCDVKNSLYYDG